MAQRLYWFLLAAISYGGFSWFGLTLAISLESSSAIWPAAGLALSAYILMPTPMILAGIWFGAFFVNLGIATQGFNLFDVPALLMGLLTSIAVTLQMLFGALLYRRILSTDRNIGTPKDIIKFVFLISPLSCLISPTAGVSLLYLNGLVSLNNYSYTWLTWWVGDTIGVMLFTPLILTLLTFNQGLSAARKLISLVPMMIILIAIVTLFFGSVSFSKRNQSSEFNKFTERLNVDINQKLLESASILRAYSAFFRASTRVTMLDFVDFSETITAVDSVFQTIAWAPVVPGAERELFEARMLGDGFPAFSIVETSRYGLVPSAVRDSYYPLTYIYPSPFDDGALGLDLGGLTSRLNVLIQAFKHGQGVATAPIQGAENINGRASFILYVPVFRVTKIISTGSPEKELIGYISGEFWISKLLQKARGEAEAKGIFIDLHDITDGVQRLQESPIRSKNGNPPLNYHINFGKRIYQLSFYSDPNYGFYKKDWISWIILTSGFLIAALLNSVILMLAATAENIRNEVARKTEDLVRATQVAIEANKAKSNFLANMSHEFRTPLNAIIGLNQLCLMTPLTVTQTDYLNKSQVASSTLLGLINDTLDYEKISLGKMELEMVPFSIYNIFEKMDAIFSTQATQKGLYFGKNILSTVPELLTGDALRLEQVLLNLCSNAIKFTEQGGVTLELFVISKKPKHIGMQFRVTDTGIGISADDQGHLFESFRQGDASTARKYGGTGLGLNISSQLINLMGGKIDVQSEVGVGSVFTIEIMFRVPHDYSGQLGLVSENGLNVQQSLAQGEPPMRVYDGAIPMESKAEVTENELQGLRLLVVEDNTLNRLVAERLLQSRGAEVTLAVDGFNALEILNSSSDFDLILLDIQMPGMDGYELARKIRELPDGVARLPLVAMTANVMTDDIDRCYNAGMDDHIGKPLDISAMSNKILLHVG
jgi:signal transduction histidine kinase/CheY-like chemotaxis protein